MRVDLHEKLMLLIEEIIDDLESGRLVGEGRSIDGSSVYVSGHLAEGGIVILEIQGLFYD